MSNLSLQELCILLIIIVVIAIAVGFFFKSVVKVILAISIGACMFFLIFKWLPPQLDRIDRGEISTEGLISEVIKDIDDTGLPSKIEGTVSSSVDYVNNNKEGWWESLIGVFAKLSSPKETPTSTDTP